MHLHNTIISFKSIFLVIVIKQVLIVEALCICVLRRSFASELAKLSVDIN